MEERGHTEGYGGHYDEGGVSEGGHERGVSDQYSKGHYDQVGIC